MEKEPVNDGAKSIKKRKKFITAFIEHKGVVVLACEKAGIGNKTYYRWLKDADFVEQLNEACNAAAQSIKDIVKEKFLAVFEKSSKELLGEEPPALLSPNGTPQLTLKGSEFIALGKELNLIAKELTPVEQADTTGVENLLLALAQIKQAKTTPIVENVGTEDPNGEEEEKEEAEEEDLDDEL